MHRRVGPGWLAGFTPLPRPSKPQSQAFLSAAPCPAAPGRLRHAPVHAGSALPPCFRSAAPAAVHHRAPRFVADGLLPFRAGRGMLVAVSFQRRLPHRGRALTSRPSRRRFVPAKGWQRKPASLFPPLRVAA